MSLTTKPEAAVVDIKRARPILDTINWSFSTPFSAGRSGVALFDCRKYHWYPATFIPEIPYTLIEVLTKPEAVVYDPFGGICTTFFQALLLGRVPYTTELCKVSVDFARSITTLLSPVTDLTTILDEFKVIKASYEKKRDYSSSLVGSEVKVELLRPWFSPDTFNEVLHLIVSERECPSSGTRAALRIALSATLKAVCAQDRGWGCISDNVLPKREQLQIQRNAFDRLGRNLNVLIKDLSSVKAHLPLSAQNLLLSGDFATRIIEADVRQSTSIPEDSVDFIITSPPYPNMTDYIFSQRLSYYWLGEDPKDYYQSEIGARRKRSMSTAIEQYSHDMFQVMQALRGKLKPGGFACFVMPAFTSEKRDDTARQQAVQQCIATLDTNGFVREHEFSRVLPTQRRHHNQKWTSLDREDIYLYRKL